MEQNTNTTEEQIKKLEEKIISPDFWNDKNKAQAVLKELSELKTNRAGVNKYDKGNAVLTIISGAGGDDAEDFSKMLLSMYLKYANKKGWGIHFIHEHKNEHGGYKNVSLEICESKASANVYGLLKNESGVHRLVRISPFNAKKLRHTSFSLVEVLPKFSKLEERDVVIPEADLKIEFARSSGPGGQNVNKRETAVRIVHIPTGIAVHASGERSQEQNRESALSIFVLHPYKMVKDHRTDVETSNAEAVLNGEIDIFIEAEKNL
ncbi:MAG: Peptide chain release factor 2 [Parcubacteria group bacterium GW2011_GWA2_36_24]|nr:MAG: Peptide chain release factor 2 [Parcubacteria group bacterium GW2011_GWA2_36_24]